MTKPSNRIEIPQAEQTPQIRNRLRPMREALEILEPNPTSIEEEIADAVGQRLPYAPMHVHRERAALALASGGTAKMAAVYAGVSTKQIKKYMTQPVFRTRIEEIRSTLMSKIRGRLLKEMERRTDSKHIENIELLDLLRIYDRMSGATGGTKGAGDVNVNITNYDTLLQALITPNPGAQGADFPVLQVGGPSLSDPDTQE